MAALWLPVALEVRRRWKRTERDAEGLGIKNLVPMEPFMGTGVLANLLPLPSALQAASFYRRNFFLGARGLVASRAISRHAQAYSASA